MKHRLELIWYFIEVIYTRLLRTFGITKNISVIPKGQYCYTIDEDKNVKEPLPNGYWIKPCRYYRSTEKTLGIACTYVGFYGLDPCLYDQCKICGENDD